MKHCKTCLSLLQCLFVSHVFCSQHSWFGQRVRHCCMETIWRLFYFSLSCVSPRTQTLSAYPLLFNPPPFILVWFSPSSNTDSLYGLCPSHGMFKPAQTFFAQIGFDCCKAQNFLDFTAHDAVYTRYNWTSPRRPLCLTQFLFLGHEPAFRTLHFSGMNLLAVDFWYQFPQNLCFTKTLESFRHFDHEVLTRSLTFLWAPLLLRTYHSKYLHLLALETVHQVLQNLLYGVFLSHEPTHWATHRSKIKL